MAETMVENTAAKIGVFLCSGCGIGDALDLEDLTTVAGEAGDNGAAVCKTHPCLCNDEGVALINETIAGDELNRVCVAACSGRVMTEAFDFGPEMHVDRTPLREQVVWVSKPNDEDTQMLAQDYVRMAVAKLEHSEAPIAEILDTDKTVMVVGGGVTGLTAAKAAADAGYDVVLVEKEVQLGGWTNKFGKKFPTAAPWTDLETGGCADLAAAVEAHDRIQVLTGCTVESTNGGPGMFDVTIAGSSPQERSVGAIVQATGFRPYPPEKLGHLGYGKSADVVTNIQVEEMFNVGSFKRPSTGQAPRNVVFIQCAGSRDQDHLPYCSTVCCRTSLKQAAMIREQLPDTKVYIIYKDLRSPGQFELFYQKMQQDEGVFLTKGEITEVTPDGDTIAVRATDTLLGEHIELKADMVVLAAGMVPSTLVDDGILEKTADAGDVGDLGATGALDDRGEAEAESGDQGDSGDAGPGDAGNGGGGDAAGAESGARILNLGYRQGTDLPTLKYGFPDSHFVCFPYETRRTAIYAAGCVRGPMDTVQSSKDAYGAALKAIQAVELTARGEAVHPRARDLSVPDFFLQRCTQCKRCTEECPFGTLNEDEKGTPELNTARCRRCGICLGACPERIISFPDFSVDAIAAAIKAMSVPDEFDEKPRILALLCENDALPALDAAALARKQWNAWTRVIPLRCLGSMNLVWIAEALSRGIDGVILVGCKHGDDYQCHYVHGSELATTRLENVQETLTRLALEPERVKVVELAHDESDRIPQLLDEFADELEELGASPLKGF